MRDEIADETQVCFQSTPSNICSYAVTRTKNISKSGPSTSSKKKREEAMMPIDIVIDWILVAVFGGLVGMGELIARYRDAPARAITTLPALLYITLNILAALLALAVTHTFGWRFGVDATSPEEQLRLIQVLVAGFAAMALFRSSLFNVRVGNLDVPVGPSSFLQIVLAAADQAVDRLRARSRAAAVVKAMRDVSFDKANVALPTFALALMQNLPPEYQKQFGDQIASLRGAQMEDYFKSLSLGISIMNVMGEDVLNQAVSSLGEKIKVEPVGGPAQPAGGGPAQPPVGEHE
ncbi:MAG TPA: hypothetical protein VGE45_09410 [Chloroflexia bacterium]